MIYNISADYIVNNTLVRDRIGTMPSIVNAIKTLNTKAGLQKKYMTTYTKSKKNGEEYLKQLGEMLDEHLDMEVTMVTVSRRSKQKIEWQC